MIWVMALSGACTPPPPDGESLSSPTGIASSSSYNASTESSVATSTLEITKGIPVTGHLMVPANLVPLPGKMIDDVESSGTGSEGRAPYGDSYKLNRFERPFLKDMTYMADIDIHKFGLSEDEDWYYISIQLMGNDPNHAPGINYGAEIDLNADGFGDYILWTHPPYSPQWDTNTVQVFQDSNQDTGGLSALKADAVSDGDGYDTLVFDGSSQENADPDLAWVRTTGSDGATVQIAFKKSLTGSAFILGVVADAGLKDISKFDYADHIAEADAGSSVQNNPYYPLGALYAVDNTCWEAYGIQMTGYEPKLCQPILQPVSTGSPDEEEEPVLFCNPPPNCGGGPYDPVTCNCQ
jgi:hypothetical protein